MSSDLKARAVAAMMRAAETLDEIHAGLPAAPTPYLRTVASEITGDAAVLRTFATNVCEHTDDEYVDEADCDECCSHCNACGRRWAFGEGREVSA